VLLTWSVKELVLKTLTAAAKLKPAKKELEFAGAHGLAKVLSATEWLRPWNWNSTTLPAAAVKEFGVKVKPPS